MRLLDTSTLEVKEFLQPQLPEYAILSHTWELEEVTFQDIQSGTAGQKKGFTKILRCCQKAAEDGYAYCWIDTCCIDKTSSAELSEAINSMYQWYQDSSVCYAYLADLVTPSPDGFRKCKWFTRGFTLQELVAPTVVEFYDADWKEYGTKLSLQETITEITGINPHVLQGGSPTLCTVAKRMSWAAHRKTTRLEDQAYCLIGLFCVNMPLLYGEGQRAFRRLQEAIMREEEDYTLFAWTDAHNSRSLGLLAQSPRDFARLTVKLDQSTAVSCDQDKLSKSPMPLLTSSDAGSTPFSLTNRGLHISVPVITPDLFQYITACLTTFTIPDTGPIVYLLCVRLYPHGVQGRFFRKSGEPLFTVPEEQGAAFRLKTIYVKQPSDIQTTFWTPDVTTNKELTLVLIKTCAQAGLEIMQASLSLRNMQQVLDARVHDNTGVGPSTVPIVATETVQDQILELHRLPDATLHELAMHHPGSCLLVQAGIWPALNWYPETNLIKCLVKSHPQSEIMVSLGSWGNDLGFHLNLRHPSLWQIIDESGELVAIKLSQYKHLYDLYTRADGPRRDRAVLQIQLERDGKAPFLRTKERHQISLSLRRVSSMSRKFPTRRFVLLVEHQLLSSRSCEVPHWYDESAVPWRETQTPTTTDAKQVFALLMPTRPDVETLALFPLLPLMKGQARSLARQESTSEESSSED